MLKDGDADLLYEDVVRETGSDYTWRELSIMDVWQGCPPPMFSLFDDIFKVTAIAKVNEVRALRIRFLCAHHSSSSLCAAGALNCTNRIVVGESPSPAAIETTRESRVSADAISSASPNKAAPPVWQHPASVGWGSLLRTEQRPLITTREVLQLHQNTTQQIKTWVPPSQRERYLKT